MIARSEISAGPSPNVVAEPKTNWRPLPVLMIGTFLIVLDFFIVNVSIPSMQRGLHASAGSIEWVIVGYGLTFAVFLIAGGRIGDRIGYRHGFLAGVGLFVVASAACGLAPTTAALITARLVQGMGAALISPNVLSLIGVLYPGPARVRAIMVYGLVMGLAATSGQIIGGTLIEANVGGAGWRAIFLINIPIGATALVVAPKLIPESRKHPSGRLDILGIMLSAAGLTALVVPLLEGRQLGWPAWTWASLMSASLILFALARYERLLAQRGGEPLLHPEVFRDRYLRAGFITQVVCWCTQASFFLVLALYLQDGRGLDPLRSGLMFAILACAYVSASFWAPMLNARLGRDLVMIGALSVALGDLALLIALSRIGVVGGIFWLAPGLILVGTGQGLWITPLTSTVLSFAAPARAGVLSGTLSTMQQVGNSLGVAITGVIFFGTLGEGYATAFGYALIGLSACMVIAAALTRMLPQSRRS